MHVSNEVASILNQIFSYAADAHYEYVTPELMLYMICKNKVFAKAFVRCGGDVKRLAADLKGYLNQYMEESSRQERAPELSDAMGEVLVRAWEAAQNSGKAAAELAHIVHAVYQLEQSYAVYYMTVQNVERAQLLREMAMIDGETENAFAGAGSGQDLEDYEEETKGEALWQQFAVCINDALDSVNPLIGREDVLERTMQILCRKDKNNPMHIGEPGVGKTAITYGLARLINENKVPKPLKNARIFALDIGSLLAGTQYRGDFEKRFRSVMDSISDEEKPIIYIDEIHNIVGAGAVNGGSFDISNMLKPYLADGHIRFIGATTYEEYKKHFEKSKSLVRRFQNIEIKEPTASDTVKILEGLRRNYEKYHNVKYEKGVFEYAVEMASKYINERFLPDKAIDLIDEAGAYRRMHPLDRKTQTVNKALIDEIIASTCNIPKQTVKRDETQSLATLERRMLKRIYG